MNRRSVVVLAALLGAIAGSAARAASTETAVAGSTAPAAPQYVWELDDVVKLALQNNPDLQSARANFEAASQVVGESFGGYLPHADAWGFLGRTTLPSPSAGLTPLLGENRPYGYGIVGVKQTVFDFGRGLDEIRTSKELAGSAEQELIGLRNVVQLSAERAFYDVALSSRLVQVARQSLEQFQETHRRAQLLVKSGVRPDFDLTQAQVELAKAELALINAKNALDLAKIALLNVMGLDKLATFELRDATEGVPLLRIRELVMDRLVDKALVARPEMKRSQYELRASEARLRRETTGYFPQFQAAGWYGGFLPDYPEALRTAWGVGLTANWSLFDGMSTTYRRRELRARIEQEQALLKRQSQGVTAQVAAGYMNVVRAEQNETVADEAAKFARENFGYAQKRYDANVRTILELLVAQSSLVNAEAAQVQARYRYATALAALQQAVNAPLTND